MSPDSPHLPPDPFAASDARTDPLARIRAEAGFSLIEILTVLMLISILAALTLPTLFDNRSKGQDAAAKSNARSTVSKVEGCFVEEGDYTRCVTPSVLTDTGIPVAGPLAVSVSGTSDTYRIVARSLSRGGTQSFVVEKDGSGRLTHLCGRPGEGGCASEADPVGNYW